MKQLSQKEFEKCPKWLKKPKTFHSKLETLRYETIPIILFILILWGKNYLLYYRYRCYRYRYRPIWKLSYRYFIGIGRYEKKLIGCSLAVSHQKFCSSTGGMQYIIHKNYIHFSLTFLLFSSMKYFILSHSMNPNLG